MRYIKIIKSEVDHQEALQRLMSLMDINPSEGSEQADELDVLALLIEQYEVEQFPVEAPDPVQAIKFRMDQLGMKNKDLIPYIGSAPKVSEVLNGTRRLSLNMIRRLSSGLGISAEILIREPEQKLAQEYLIEWDRFPLSAMRKHDYFPNFTGNLQELKEYAEEVLSGFLSSIRGGLDLEPAMLRSSAHLRSNDKETDFYAIWAWQARVLQRAEEGEMNVEYALGTVTKEWMQKLAQESWSKSGPLLAKEYLNKAGIHLILEPHLPKTYLDGAVCINHNGNPIVALTLRHDRLDNFWFSLMHELAHIALHIDKTETWFIDDLDAKSNNAMEDEADELAQACLLPIHKSELISIETAEEVREFAKSFNVSPCVIAGRIRHERDDHRLFGRLFRDKVKDILCA